MSADRRRQSILEAALPLFAEHGPHVTTKQIADAAGVSEALLYKHFDSKEALYTELQQFCVRSEERESGLSQLVPSTSTLVIGLYWLFRWMLIGGDRGREHNRHIRRLILTSVLEDGDFARGFLNRNVLPLFQRLVLCLPAAEEAGDLVEGSDPSITSLWLAQACAAGVAMFTRAAPPVVDYGKPPELLLPDLVRFALRGIGLKPEAIERHLNAEAFTLLNGK